MRGVYFFATGNDLFELLKEINKSMPIEFVKSGSYNSKQDIVKRIVSELANISTVLVNLFCNTLFDKYLIKSNLHWC